MAMIKPGTLAKRLAEAFGLPEASIILHDRYLAEANLRTRKGRGRSASPVSARDVAHNVVAILASAQIKDSVLSVRRYAATRADVSRSSEGLFRSCFLGELAELPDDHSFVDALEALIRSVTKGSLAERLERVAGVDTVRPLPSIEIAALTPGTMADLRITGAGRQGSRHVRYTLPDPFAAGSNPTTAELKQWEATIKQYRIESDFEQYRRISQTTIYRLASLLTT